jgi:hypothetical protein
VIGISHSHFLGGPARWNQDDRDKALAFEWYNREKCPVCGTFEEEWRDEEGWKLTPPRWQAVDRRCLGCEELERKRELIPKGERGVYVGLAPFDDTEDDDDEQQPE